ncbi:MAG: hydantoinase/oxoprolinase family protein [Planctomycetota bacterium]|jgi:N-methylhydantoinase A
MQVVGVDTGGTFTDFTLEDRVFKLRSTPDDPARAVVEGLEKLAGPLRVVHGTTVATNALLTRGGARTAFVTTEGLEDLLEIGRQDRRDLYALQPRRHEPLVAPSDRFGVHERLRADGSVEVPLRIGDLVRRISESGVEAVAVCMLHAYRNPEHELAVAEALRTTGLPLSLSHLIANEFREFERAATTAANASLMPVLAPYVRRLRTALSDHVLEILQSNGGTATPEEIADLPVRTVLSGPAGGVVAAAELARRHGIEDAVSFDMGGTSTDVALIRGTPEVMPEFKIDGLPLRVPVLDVHTVGAGGGSLAHVDALGALRVGPQSAGADPGPACYGQGDRPTVTDAHVVLGHLTENDRLAGTLRLDVARARAAVGDTARDILRVADATMERAIRNVTVRRGIDPRPCTLIAFGGAGPLHACALADALAMEAVLIPPDPGTFSAHGMRTADRRRDYVRTVLLPAAECVARLGELFEPLRAGHTAAREIVTADARYRGQSHELSVPADERLAERFHAAHAGAFGYCEETRPVEVVNLRLAAVDPAPRPDPFPARQPVAARAGPARRPREGLEGAICGPTVLTELTATTVVPAPWRAEVLGDGSLLLERRS